MIAKITARAEAIIVMIMYGVLLEKIEFAGLLINRDLDRVTCGGSVEIGEPQSIDTVFFCNKREGASLRVAVPSIQYETAIRSIDPEVNGTVVAVFGVDASNGSCHVVSSN